MGAGTGSQAGPDDCNATATITAWLATGDPVTFGTTGTRHFAVNAGNTIWQNTADVALTDADFPAGGTISPIQ
jgi:hypothetical protein